MTFHDRVLRTSLVGLALLGTMSSATTAGLQTLTPEETTRSVQRLLERLQYYGVFDFIAFGVNPAGGVEWFKAAHGAWHAGGPIH